MSRVHITDDGRILVCKAKDIAIASMETDHTLTQ